jgi:hypothetical protein
LRANILPGLALAGGVLIAAVIALLLIGGAPSQDGGLPDGDGPTATRLIPGGGDAGRDGDGSGAGGGQGSGKGRGGSAAEAQYGARGSRGAVLGEPAGRQASGSAAESQYGAGGNRGTVLEGPGAPG